MSITFTDQFCGAGGSTTGATLAGLEPVLAMNHWRLAIDTHGTNYPEVDHACVDVASTDPRAFPRTDVLLTSPECRAHSYARGRPKDDPTLFNPDQGAERSRWDILRVVWGDSESPRASHRRAAVEQLCREHPDLVRFMSRIPPPPCAACWSDGSWESSLSRVTTRTENRARRLSALGNGVVPQCAELIGLRILQLEEAA